MCNVFLQITYSNYSITIAHNRHRRGKRHPMATPWPTAVAYARDAGEPHTSKVTRALRKLEANKLAEKTRRGPWRLTAAGREKAEALAGGRP
jgi:hypothetical protein